MPDVIIISRIHDTEKLLFRCAVYILGGNSIILRGFEIKHIHYNVSICVISLLLIICIILPWQINGDFEYRADYEAGDGPHGACIADLDDDGDLDIVSADYYADKVSILMNNGEGVFTKEDDYQTGDGPRSLFLGDVDGDDDIDIVTANYHGDSISVLKNQGSGTFAQKSDYDVGEGPYSVFLSDIGEDGNGDLDVITADDQSDKVSVLKNQGNGVFGDLKTYKVGSRPKGVFSDDLNDDGYNDIVTANWADYSISVLMNKKDGTFEKDVNYDTGDAPRSIFLADLDGNDIPDIATANQYSSSISILMNNGDGTFGSKTDYDVGTNPISVFLGDIDGDEDNDALTTNLVDNTISVLKNDGSGNLGNRMDYNTDDGPYSVLLGDVNDDDEVDMITANNYADTVSVHYSHFPASISIFQPDGVDDIANNSYAIAWEDFYPYGEATIAFYWDDDNSGLDGTQIVSGLSEDDDGIGGSYVWNISAIPEGDYWIYASIDDGTFESRHDYSPGMLTINHSMITNTPPTFQITEPDGNSDCADMEFIIMWMDSDPDDDASISLFYDTNDFGYDGEPIEDGLSEDAHGSSGFYYWNTTEITEGEYYIYGICDDGYNEAVRRYSTYTVTINHTTSEDPTSTNNETPSKNNPPLIQLVEPDGEEDHTDKEYMITWIDSDLDDDASISLYYDSDSAGYDGILIASNLSEDKHGNSGLYIWNTASIPEGNYHIYAIIDDGTVDAKDYSPGKITIDHPSVFNTAPKIMILTPEKGVVEVRKTYMIGWIDSDPDDDASISIYYDDDQIGYDGALIVSGLSEDEVNNSYIWDLSGVPEGDYYIYGMIDDGVNKVVYDYSDGIVIINHSKDGEENGDGQEFLSQNYPLFLLLILILILILAFFILKRRSKSEEEEVEDDFEEPEEDLHLSLENIEDEEIDEELLSSSDDIED